MQTHCSSYTGLFVSLELESEDIRVTGNHPFWVEQGRQLDARPSLEEPLASIRDRAFERPGRWVNSQDLLAGDRLLRRNGSAIEVKSVDLQEVEDEDV